MGWASDEGIDIGDEDFQRVCSRSRRGEHNMGSKQIEIAVQIRVETEKAYLVFDGKTEAWIPKSQITDYSEDDGVIKTIFISEWMAEQKGLI